MFEFRALNLPPCKLKIFDSSDAHFLVWDIVRQKKIVLTPEEWVRQHWIHYLINQKKCPQSLINVETSIPFNNKIKRSDIVVRDRNNQPKLLVECKSYTIKIKQNSDVLIQAAMYHSVLQCPYICVSNGLEHINIKKDGEEHYFIEQIPLFSQM